MAEEKLYKSLVPLSKVVSSAAVDDWADAGDVTELYSHWGARGYKKLNREVFKKGGRYVLLTINKNTRTATLPPDVGSEQDITFIGVVNEDGERIPIMVNRNLAPHSKFIEEADGVDECDKCHSKKKVCEELQVTEQVNTIVIDGNVYEETITKKLYPNGDYFIEKTTPVKDLDTDTVAYDTSKKFVTNFDLRDCGCFDETEKNVCALKNNCPDIYCKYFSPVVTSCEPKNIIGGYRIFEELGIIQFDRNYEFGAVYIEYNGFLPRVNGQYYVPEIAFETLVEWIRYKNVDGKKSVPVGEKVRRRGLYQAEYSNMIKSMTSFDISLITNAARMIPKFNLNEPKWKDCYAKNRYLDLVSKQKDVKTIIENTNTVVKTVTEKLVYGKSQFTVGAEDSLMEVGASVFEINLAGVKSGSVNVVLDTATLPENNNTQISYTVAYELNKAVITFNQPVRDGQNYTITYVRSITT